MRTISGTRIVALALLAAAAALAEEIPTEPAPGLGPAEAVRAQLAALQNNDEPSTDHGVRVAFRFASPENREVTGPLPRFSRMLRNKTYGPLMNHRSHWLGELRQGDGTAQQRVTVIGPNGERARYIFVLSRQAGPPCEGCWMTDSVIRVETTVDEEADFALEGPGMRRIRPGAVKRVKRRSGPPNRLNCVPTARAS